MVQLITAVRLILSIAFPLVSVRATPVVTLVIYLISLASDVADGALARRWRCATRGGDWYDAFADRMLTTMSGVYGLMVGGPILACSLIIARDLSAVSMNELQSEGSNRRARFLGIVTVTPIRFLTLVVIVSRLNELDLSGVLPLYWICALIAWSTFGVNFYLRRGTVAASFREPDVEKLLR